MIRRLTGRVMVPGAIALALFVAVAAYAYFVRSGSGTGTAPVVSFSAPVVSPAGEPAFADTDLVPGDSDSRLVTVTAAAGGPPSTIALYEQALTGSLTRELNLQIIEDDARTVYDGPLASGWTATSPFALPGSGGGLWAPGEQHSFRFTVSFPKDVGNSAQSANASLNFVWLREVG